MFRHNFHPQKFGEEEKSKEKEKDNKAGTAGKGKVVGKKGTDKAEGGDGKRQVRGGMSGGGEGQWGMLVDSLGVFAY